MVEKRLFYGGMDSDTDDKLIEQGDYRDAVNVRNSIPDKSDVGSLPNVKGNLLVPYSAPSGQNKTIGHYDDVLNKRIISFVWNENGEHEITVYYTSTGVKSKLIGNTLLNFNPDFLILHIDVIEDLLLWTDNYNEPCAILISKAQTGFYDNVTSRQYFDAIAYPNNFSPSGQYVSDDTYLQNNLRGKIFQFRQTFVDEMDRETAASPISKMSIPVSEPQYLPDGNYQTYINNKIELSIQTGIDMVRKINIYVREGNNSDWYLAKSLIKADLGIGNNQTYVFGFYNDEAWIPVSQPYINRLFDRIPILSNCQAQTSDKRILYSNIVEGYDNIIPDCSVRSIYNEISPIDSTLQAMLPPSSPGDPYTPTGPIGTNISSQTTSLSPGVIQPTLINITATNILEEQVFIVSYDFSMGVSTSQFYVERKDVFTQSFAPGTTSYNIASYFATLINASNILSGSINVPAIPPTIPASTVTFQTSAVAISNGSSAILSIVTNQSGIVTLDPQNQIQRIVISDNQIHKSLKRASWYKIGIVYYDQANRSGTVQFGPTMDLKVDPYSMTPTQLGSVIAELTINHIAPSWANYYQVVITDNLNKLDYIQIKCGTVSAVGTNYKIYINTIATFNTQYPNAVDFVYEFTKGDRLTLLFDTSLDAITSYVDVEILSSDDDVGGQFILVANTISIPPVSNQYIEIYTPKQTIAEQIFWEIGEVYPITGGFHTGNIQNQTVSQPAIIQFTGDTYFRYRSGNMTFFVESKSLSDFYSSESWDKGRPNRIDTEAKQIRRFSTTYYTEPYIPETNLNGLSVVFDTSFESGDIKYGVIQRTYAEEDRVEFYYQLKTSWRLINKSILYAADGTTSVQKSDTVLSQESFFEGEFGISDNPESFAAYENDRYHVDAINGVVCRLTQSGYDPISNFKMTRYFSEVLKTRADFGEPFKVWGVFDRKHKEYVLCFEEVIREVQVAVEDAVVDGGVVSTSETIDLGDTTVIAMGESSRSTAPTDVDSGTSSRGGPTGGSRRSTTVIYTLDPITIAFSKPKNRWVERYKFLPECIGSVGIGVASYKDGALYIHDANPLYNNFYGVQYDSEVKFLSNAEPSAKKLFQNIYTESTYPWSMVAINKSGQSTSLEASDFENVEGVYYADLLKDSNTPNVTDPLIYGDDMLDYTMEITLTNNESVESNLFAVNVRHVRSMLTNV